MGDHRQGHTGGASADARGRSCRHRTVDRQEEASRGAGGGEKGGKGGGEGNGCGQGQGQGGPRRAEARHAADQAGGAPSHSEAGCRAPRQRWRCCRRRHAGRQEGAEADLRRVQGRAAAFGGEDQGVGAGPPRGGPPGDRPPHAGDRPPPEPRCPRALAGGHRLGDLGCRAAGALHEARACRARRRRPGARGVEGGVVAAPGRGLGVAGLLIRQRSARHLGGRNGLGQNHPDDSAAAAHPGAQRQRRSPPRRGAKVLPLKLAERVRPFCARLQRPRAHGGPGGARGRTREDAAGDRQGLALRVGHELRAGVSQRLAQQE
mmetsp:Transcript_31757/g.80247  ORF Transcript_31757/g.80247 Transcript_31757/m.80247 type:complete len:319 (-) Transcript_31757:1136-2092(-)